MDPSDISMAIWMAEQMQPQQLQASHISRPRREPKPAKAEEKKIKMRTVPIFFGFTNEEFQTLREAEEKIPLADSPYWEPEKATQQELMAIEAAKQTIERIRGKKPPEETLEEWVEFNPEVAAELVSEPLEPNIRTWHQIVRFYVKEVPMSEHDPCEYAQRKMTLLLKRYRRQNPQRQQPAPQFVDLGEPMSSHDVAQALLTKPDLPLVCDGFGRIVRVSGVSIAALRDTEDNRTPCAVLKIANGQS